MAASSILVSRWEVKFSFLHLHGGVFRYFWIMSEAGVSILIIDSFDIHIMPISLRLFCFKRILSKAVKVGRRDMLLSVILLI